MRFQCEASELEKAIAKIKQWKAEIDTPKNLKYINGVSIGEAQNQQFICPYLEKMSN